MRVELNGKPGQCLKNEFWTSGVKNGGDKWGGGFKLALRFFFFLCEFESLAVLRPMRSIKIIYWRKFISIFFYALIN